MFELKTYQLYTQLTPPANFLLYVAKNLLERAKWKYHSYLNKRRHFPNSLSKKIGGCLIFVHKIKHRPIKYRYFAEDWRLSKGAFYCSKYGNEMRKEIAVSLWTWKMWKNRCHLTTAHQIIHSDFCLKHIWGCIIHSLGNLTSEKSYIFNKIFHMAVLATILSVRFTM